MEEQLTADSSYVTIASLDLDQEFKPLNTPFRILKDWIVDI